MRNMFAYIIHLLLLPLFLTSCEKDSGEKWETNHPKEEETEQTEQPSQYGAPFGNVPETPDVAMYEVNLRAYSQEGNLGGVKAKLDSIEALGINVVWLMPIYPTGDVKAVGSPYAVKDYKAIHDDYGTLDDLRSLVDEAHQRDMAVILDWVANHTAWDHEWITEHPSWYAQDDNGNIIIPPGTGWEDVAELNYDNQSLREEMIQSMKYWVLEANVDGFRCDYAHGVPDDFWKQAIDTLRSIPDRDIIMFAESERKELLTSGFDMMFGWRFYTGLKESFNEGQPASAIIEAHDEEYYGLSSEKHVLRWITNHDQNAWETTPDEQFNNKDGSMAAFVVSAYMGGVPLIYSGQEVGFPDQISFFEGNVNKIDWTINPDYKEEYEKVLNFRQNNTALRRGSLINYKSNDVMAFERTSGDETVLVLVNLRNSSVQYAVPDDLQNTNWNEGFTGAEVTLETSLELAPYEYVIYKK
ncbi:alpha-amylase family glycosyl hydrolase [Marinilabilia rubra]|uniref:Alpha-amylase n=1 Tax=Marinilabilia rubra TaxID=2162893 RepID=A0A2U2B6D1_9BACT|nr:alpha-amylase family glycosyl hydrolase [Marinilabilia rubra]PWD98606.1 alpha-amylase [Marinilabilia rubra]